MVLTDTGYWLALANSKDKWHQRAVEVTHQTTERLIITWPVITETCYLFDRSGVNAQTLFMQELYRNVDIFDLNRDHINQAKELMIKYANIPMDLADASLVIAANELGSGRIFSTDQRDFAAYGWKNHHPFSNLLLPE